MENEKNLADQLAVIEEALVSPKVDPYMVSEFRMLKTQLGFNVESEVAFLAKVRTTNIEFEGPYIFCGIGDILAIRAPYSALPSIVENEDVISLQATKTATDRG